MCKHLTPYSKKPSPRPPTSLHVGMNRASLSPYPPPKKTVPEASQGSSDALDQNCRHRVHLPLTLPSTDSLKAKLLTGANGNISML